MSDPDERTLEDREGRAYARWAAAPLLSGGFLAPVPFFVASSRTGRRHYLWAAAFWTVMVAACVTCLAIAGAGNGPLTTIGGFLVLADMGGATAHTLWIRQRVGRELAIQQDPRLTAAERAVDTRKQALGIAQADPHRALELGIGRPDLEGSFDGGLIDVNHAPAEVLQRLPGIGPEQSKRIVELRMSGSGFVSTEDLGMVLDLDPGVMAELAPRAVFLPRF